MGMRGNPGLAALGDLARLDRRPDPYHLGFVLVPRINAGGPVGRAPLRARLLATSHPVQPAALPVVLDRPHHARPAIRTSSFCLTFFPYLYFSFFLLSLFIFSFFSF